MNEIFVIVSDTFAGYDENSTQEKWISQVVVCFGAYKSKHAAEQKINEIDEDEKQNYYVVSMWLFE